VFVVELAGLQAVVKLAEEFVEQVSLGLAVPVSGARRASKWRRAPGELRSDASAQIEPTAAA
jgi:hypothetical protein